MGIYTFGIFHLEYRETSTTVKWKSPKTNQWLEDGALVIPQVGHNPLTNQSIAILDTAKANHLMHKYNCSSVPGT